MALRTRAADSHMRNVDWPRSRWQIVINARLPAASSTAARIFRRDFARFFLRPDRGHGLGTGQTLVNLFYGAEEPRGYLPGWVERTSRREEGVAVGDEGGVPR